MKFVGLAVAAVLAVWPLPSQAAVSGLCVEARLPLEAGEEARPLKFGVTAAGQVFTRQPGFPDDPARTLAALDDLGDGLLVRVNRVFFRDGDAAIDRAETEAARFASAGHEVTLQLRYGPQGAAGPPVPEEFAAWVGEVIERMATNPSVTGIEVTNEPNLTSAPDNSDGAFAGVVEALVLGVRRARAVIDTNGWSHMKVGFNWFYETGPADEAVFWTALRETGGDSFAAALDWVGLNAYPGTYDFLPVAPTLEGAEMVQALRLMRECYLPMAGIPGTVPIRVIENGYPNGAARTAGLMADALERMAHAVHDHAGTFNVTHYLWFTLRDTVTGFPTNEANYGLLTHDYQRKPAFDRYRDVIAQLGAS